VPQYDPDPAIFFVVFGDHPGQRCFDADARGRIGPLVLVAHDSEVVRRMVTDILTGAGFKAEFRD